MVGPKKPDTLTLVPLLEMIPDAEDREHPIPSTLGDARLLWPLPPRRRGHDLPR